MPNIFPYLRLFLWTAFREHAEFLLVLVLSAEQHRKQNNASSQFNGFLLFCSQAHKRAVKEANRERRKHKTPKHIKKAHKSKAGKK